MATYNTIMERLEDLIKEQHIANVQLEVIALSLRKIVELMEAKRKRGF